MTATPSTSGSQPPTTLAGLPAGQAAAAVAYGLAFWLTAALVVRWAPPALFAGGWTTALVFLASVPLGWASVPLSARLLRLQPGQVLAATVLATVAAALADGVGLTWTELYGPGDRTVGAAWILWGVGVILLSGLWNGPRRA
jgi:hypothetical protein